MHPEPLTVKQVWRADNIDQIRAHDRARDAIRNTTPERKAQKLAAQKRYAEKHRAAIRERRLPNQRRYSWKRNGIPTPPYPAPATCQCCGGPPIPTHGLAVDHCHKTGVFRGWLCVKCNSGIGMLGDDIAGLKRALAYLEQK